MKHVVVSLSGGNFGRFIDDIRAEIKWLNISFEEVPFGEQMILSIPPSTKTCIIDSRNTKEIKSNSPLYSELLNLTLQQLKNFNNPNFNLE